MKALSVQEIDALAASLEPMLGARLQEVVVGATGVGLGFWTGRRHQGLVWLWYEDHIWSPLLLHLNQCPETALKPAKPLALFLRAHFLSHPLERIWRDDRLGRALVLDFGDEAGADRRIEFHLWPHGGNLLAYAENRRVALKKIVPATAPPPVESPHQRSLPELIDEWTLLRGQRRDRGKPKTGEPRSAEKKLQSEIARLERALGKVDEEIQNKREQPYREVGNWLVQEQTLHAPHEWQSFIDKRRTLAWNIENCFARAKDIERKLESTRSRRDSLKRELSALKKMSPEEILTKDVRRTSAKNKNEKKSRFRTLRLPGGLVARIGLSAGDNAQLLRSAKAWDLWLHLRDYPGGHAIVSRDKKDRVSDEVLRLVGAALVAQTFGRKAGQHVGERFEIIIAECRFVRPIKGAQRGLVNYSHDRTLRFVYSSDAPQQAPRS